MAYILNMESATYGELNKDNINNDGGKGSIEHFQNTSSLKILERLKAPQS